MTGIFTALPYCDHNAALEFQLSDPALQKLMHPMNAEDIKAIKEEIPYLRRYARNRVGDPVYADDLVQSCLEKAVAKFHQFKPGTNLRGWLLAILRNHQISEFRTKRTEPPLVTLDDAVKTLGVKETQFTYLQVRELLDAFERLPDLYQEVMLLVVVEGLKYDEAAEVLDIPVGTVRSRIARGRVLLVELQTRSSRIRARTLAPTRPVRTDGGLAAALGHKLTH